MTRTNEVGETRVVGAVPATDAQPVYPHTMRLQRFLARAGVASRRGSEDLMTAGRVTVNGQVATELGTKVDVDRDQSAEAARRVPDFKDRVHFAHLASKRCSRPVRPLGA